MRVDDVATKRSNSAKNRTADTDDGFDAGVLRLLLEKDECAHHWDEHRRTDFELHPLRGEDMADVIFKGSAAGGRKPCNSAEATLVLDNLDKRLSVDASEVHVTRRVYRSGESEYLINREPCRLKDIKDLFRGTGVGIDAYSLIEQGKVDRMLQASAKDRRAIFEPAYGIEKGPNITRNARTVCEETLRK